MLLLCRLCYVMLCMSTVVCAAELPRVCINKKNFLAYAAEAKNSQVAALSCGQQTEIPNCMYVCMYVSAGGYSIPLLHTLPRKVARTVRWATHQLAWLMQLCLIKNHKPLVTAFIADVPLRRWCGGVVSGIEPTLRLNFNFYFNYNFSAAQRKKNLMDFFSLSKKGLWSRTTKLAGIGVFYCKIL